ncbi:hypothetical protein M514_04511 [Trichuris suis]|uniref:Uncharacterized protein n=1 Tax=Trichuris suis TaxID=68888 RepID=A0A085MBH0_9BILA|nr:hypothetical protein M513_04511 [Trichuris suis]KFD64901.1 hypothetical protein M514_04511 [Trichuris suis]
MDYNNEIAIPVRPVRRVTTRYGAFRSHVTRHHRKLPSLTFLGFTVCRLTWPINFGKDVSVSSIMSRRASVSPPRSGCSASDHPVERTFIYNNIRALRSCQIHRQRMMLRSTTDSKTADEASHLYVTIRKFALMATDKRLQWELINLSICP